MTSAAYAWTSLLKKIPETRLCVGTVAQRDRCACDLHNAAGANDQFLLPQTLVSLTVHNAVGTEESRVPYVLQDPAAEGELCLMWC